MKTHSIIGRVFWMLYACPMVLLFVGCEAILVWQYGAKAVVWTALDFLISFPSLLALFLHIWDTRLFVQLLWKIYAFVLIAWDLFLNLLIQPGITGHSFEPADLIGFVILAPLYVAVFRYAFRNWDEMAD